MKSYHVASYENRDLRSLIKVRILFFALVFWDSAPLCWGSFQ